MTCLTYYTDGPGRHLVCFPFSEENLHTMAVNLGIKRCWFHRGANGRFPHYDVPKRMVGHLPPSVNLVAGRVIIAIINGKDPNR